MYVCVCLVYVNLNHRMYETEGHCTFSDFRDTFYTYYTLQFLTSVFTVAGFHSSLIRAKFVLYFAHYSVIV